jgi:hypothetical protein
LLKPLLVKPSSGTLQLQKLPTDAHRIIGKVIARAASRVVRVSNLSRRGSWRALIFAAEVMRHTSHATLVIATTMAIAKVTAAAMAMATSKATISAGFAAPLGVAATVSATGAAGAAAGVTTTAATMATTALMNSVAAHAQGSGGEQRHKQQITHDAIILDSGSMRS